VLLKF